MVKKYYDVGVAVFRFLKAARNRVKEGMGKEQILDFARREFGEVTKLLRKQIDDLFKKKPTKKKEGEVVKLQSEAEKDIAEIQKSIDDLDAAEAAADADVAKDIVKKRTKDIATGDPTGETSEIMEGLEKSMKKIKKSADDLTDNPFDDFESYVLGGGKARDPRRGVVRAAAREILNKNKVKIGSEDPIDVLRQMYGEEGLDAVDAVSDGLLDAQSYGEMNTILTKNKLFDLVPKKTYGYDESVVAGEKIRKAMEQEAKNLEILKKFKPDREPSAYGGIAGTLRLNRTGYVVGSGPKVINLVIKHGPEFKKFADMLFIKASNMIRQGKGMWKGLTEKQRMIQHDNLTKKVNTFQKEGTLEGMDQYFGINAEKAFVETQAKVSAGPGKSINISDDAVAADFTNFIKKTDPEGYKKFEQTVELSNAKLGKGRKPNAEGGRVGMAKGGLPNILKL